MPRLKRGGEEDRIIFVTFIIMKTGFALKDSLVIFLIALAYPGRLV
jgi:hypothetical protein